MLIVGDCLTMSGPDRVEALHLRGGRIDALGRRADLAARYAGEATVRAERVTPALHDAHAHPLYWGQALETLDVAGLTDPRRVAEAVAARAASQPRGTWIRGQGYLFDHYPSSTLLDAAAPAHPVLVQSRDLHSAWCSKAALRAAGVGCGTPDPPGGEILRSGDGTPTGYLLERAVGLVARALPPPGPGDLERGLADFARRGFGAVHAMAYEAAPDLPWAEALARAGRLPVRLWWTLPRGAWRGTEPGWRGDDLEVAGVKFFGDGSLGSRTAWMHEPYPDGSVGRPLDPAGRIRDEGGEALDAGFTLAVHAIGTRAVEEVAAVLAALAPRTRRTLRIEHVQHVRDAGLEALATLPCALSVQPAHLPGDVPLVARLLPGREGEAYRFRDLLATGRPLAFGSDAPVIPPDAGAAIRAATSHPLSPAQSLSWGEAVRASTRGAAEAAGWRDYGVLAPGARADLALWEGERLVARVWRGSVEPVA